MNEMITIDGTEIKIAKIRAYAKIGKYLVTHNSVYQLFLATDGVARERLYKSHRLLKRGDYRFLTGKEVNDLLHMRLIPV